MTGSMAHLAPIQSGQDSKHGGNMERATQKQRHEFIHVLLEHLPETKADGKEWSWFHEGQPFAERLMRYGATLGRIAENQCNGYQDRNGNWDQQASDHEERKE